MNYEINEYTFNFKKLETIRSFWDSIFSDRTTLFEVDKQQINLLKNVLETSNRVRPRVKAEKKERSFESTKCSLWHQRISS